MPVEKEPTTQRPVVVISPWVLLGIVAYFIGAFFLPELLGVDIACTDENMPRRGVPGQIFACAVSQPPWGWFYLAWIAVPFVWLPWYIRRSLSRSIGPRR